jgi:hypothetical protein
MSTLTDVFSEKKVVESHALNYAGAQVLRVLLSSAAFASRGVTKSWPATDATRTLLDQGFVVMPDFLGSEAFAQVKADFVAAATIGKYNPIQDGDTRSERHTLPPDLWKTLPAVSRLLSDSKLIQTLEGAERKPIEIGDVWFDTVVNGDPQKGQDSQKQLHSDIFFNTHKVWFFLEPVKLEDGPLCFAPGTNRVTWKRLVFEYSKSIKYDQLSDYSFRVEPDDRAYFGFEEKPLTCPANTLVIANTCGFHRRGDAVAGHTRKQIHFCIRSRPFGFF